MLFFTKTEHHLLLHGSCLSTKCFQVWLKHALLFQGSPFLAGHLLTGQNQLVCSQQNLAKRLAETVYIPRNICRISLNKELQDQAQLISTWSWAKKINDICILSIFTMWISKACIFTTSTDMNTIHANLDFSKAVWIGCKVKKKRNIQLSWSMCGQNKVQIILKMVHWLIRNLAMKKINST